MSYAFLIKYMNMGNFFKMIIILNHHLFIVASLYFKLKVTYVLLYICVSLILQRLIYFLSRLFSCFFLFTLLLNPFTFIWVIIRLHCIISFILIIKILVMYHTILYRYISLSTSNSGFNVPLSVFALVEFFYICTHMT